MNKRRILRIAGAVTHAAFLIFTIITMILALNLVGQDHYTLLAATAALTLAALMFDFVLDTLNRSDEPVKVIYTNWRGETSERTIVPISLRYGSSEWHPEPQWLVKAYDVDKRVYREFALSGFGASSERKGS